MSTQKKFILVAFILIIVGLNIGINIWRKSNLTQPSLHEFNSLSSETSLDSMQFDQEGQIWFLSNEMGPSLQVSDKNGNRIILYTENDIGISPDFFFVDSQGRVVVRGIGKGKDAAGKDVDFEGVAVFDGTNWRLTIITKSFLNGFMPFSTFAVDQKGRIWKSGSGYKGGLWVFEENDKRINYSTANSGLSDDDVNVIAFDKEGRAWIGTSKEGINIFDGKNWITYNTENSPIHSNSMEKIYFDKQNRGWLITTEQSTIFDCGHTLTPGSCKPGVSVFDGENWTIYTPDNSGLPDTRIDEIVIDGENRALILAEGNLCILDENTYKYFYLNDFVRGIESDEMGNIWLVSFERDGANKVAVLPSNFASTSPTTTAEGRKLLTNSHIPQKGLTLLLINIWFIISSSRKGLNMVNLVPTKETKSNVQARWQDYPNNPFRASAKRLYRSGS